MKKSLLFTFTLFISFNIIIKSQVAISEGDEDAHSSAVLELISGDKGFLMTRISDRDAIESPAESLIIYNSDTNCFEIYLEGEWHDIWCEPLPPGACDGIEPPTIDGYTYEIIGIGDQCWFAENMRYDNNCSEADWVDGSDEGWCGAYNDDDGYIAEHGLLYQWSAVMDWDGEGEIPGEGAQGICPEGWRIPTHDDWSSLEQHICESAENNNCTEEFPFDDITTGNRGTDEGTRLTYNDNTWDTGELTSNESILNNSGFSALPSGRKYDNEFYDFIGQKGYWWTSTSQSTGGKKSYDSPTPPKKEESKNNTPVFHNTGGSEQLAFNNSTVNHTEPVFRISHEQTMNEVQLQLSHDVTFSDTPVFDETYSGDFTGENNFTAILSQEIIDPNLFPEGFDDNILVHGFTAPTNVWFAPESNPPIQHYPDGGNPGGRVGFSGSWNNWWGNFLRLPEVNCTGNNVVTLTFDVWHSHFPTHTDDRMRFYIWADGEYKRDVISVTIDGEDVMYELPFGNGWGFQFTEERDAAEVKVTFDISEVSNKSDILFYLEPSCGYNNSNEFYVFFDNISIITEPLTAGTTYYARTRAEVDGSWTDWSPDTMSFTYKPGKDIKWFQTEIPQFHTGELINTITKTSPDLVTLPESKKEEKDDEKGTITSTPIELASFKDATAWDELFWEQQLNDGEINMTIERYTSSGWQNIPELTDITQSGDGLKTIDISAAGNHDFIRIKAELLRQGAPEMLNWGVKTTKDDNVAWYRNLNHDNTEILRNTGSKANSFSLRCLKE